MIQRSPPAGVVARWQPELDVLAPRTSLGLAHLRLVWEPGEEWCPVERWIVYEMHPANRAPFGIYDDLTGPNPRNFGRYDATWDNRNGTRGRFVRTRHFGITMRQWLLFRETGFFGRPIWVVQGRYGGHKRWDTKIRATRPRKGAGMIGRVPGHDAASCLGKSPNLVLDSKLLTFDVAENAGVRERASILLLQVFL